MRQQTHSIVDILLNHYAFWAAITSKSLQSWKLYKDYREKRTCAQIRMLDKRTIKQSALSQSGLIPVASTNTSDYWHVPIPQRFLNNKQLEIPTIKLYQDYSLRLTQKKKTQTWFFRCQRKGESGYTQKNSLINSLMSTIEWFVIIVCQNRKVFSVIKVTSWETVNLAKTQLETLMLMRSNKHNGKWPLKLTTNKLSWRAVFEVVFLNIQFPRLVLTESI